MTKEIENNKKYEVGNILNILKEKSEKISDMWKRPQSELSDIHIKFAERTLLLKEISESELSKSQDEYIKSKAEEYEKNYKLFLMLLDAKEKDNKNFLERINQDPIRKKALLFFNVEGKENLDKFLINLSKNDIQRNAKKPEDFIIDSFYLDSNQEKIKEVFPIQYKNIENKINKNLLENLNSQPKLQRMQAVITTFKSEMKLKDYLLLGLKGVSLLNPTLFLSMQAMKFIVKSKPFQDLKENLTKKISSHINNSEKFQNFKKNNPWVNELKENKYIKYGTVLAAIAVPAAIGAFMTGSFAFDNLESNLESLKQILPSVDSASVPSLNDYIPEPQTAVDLSNQTVDIYEVDEPQVDTSTVVPPQVDASVVIPPQVDASVVVPPQIDASVVIPPQVDASVVVPPQIDASTVIDNKIDFGSNYEIQKGDCLWDIAEKTLGENASNSDILKFVDKIAEANNIPDKDLIYTGNSLVIPSIENVQELNEVIELNSTVVVENVPDNMTSVSYEHIILPVDDSLQGKPDTLITSSSGLKRSFFK